MRKSGERGLVRRRIKPQEKSQHKEAEKFFTALSKKIPRFPIQDFAVFSFDFIKLLQGNLSSLSL